MKGPLRQTISVIMPAYNAAHLLPRVLAPLIEMRDRDEVQEIIVVDDVSTDNSVEVAKNLGVAVITMPENSGPGAARNFAAKHAKSDILWFVDSDVIAWPDGARRVQDAFAKGDIAAVFGSYDELPDGTPWFSRYKNLTHRFYHQNARRDAETWWAGCGAIAADMFEKVGGFDVETYRVPSIEDIELGYRINKAGGKILLEPELQAKHLKVWTVRNSIYTDIFCRALPWSRLMIARENVTNDLNTGPMERVRAAFAGLFLLTVILSLVMLPTIWPLTLAFLIIVFALNIRLFRFFISTGGVFFAIASVLYHQLYYVYSAAAFTWCLFEYHILGRRTRFHVS